MELKKGTFRYAAGKNKKVFPIDYSVLEISKQIEIDKRTFSTNVLGHPLFRTILAKLYWSSKSNGVVSDSSDKIYPPFPVETATFFTCFL